MLRKGNSHFIYIHRPDSYWDVVCYHFPLALVTGLPLVTAFTATPGSLPLISCTFKALTGYPCPFCGFTRSFFAMASGDWAYAFFNCPLGVVFFTVCAILFTWNAVGLFSGAQISVLKYLRLNAVQGKYAFLVVCLLLLVNWAYRLTEGLK